MKKLITILSLLLTANLFAQSPNKMSYQAVIRNSSNTLVTNSAVGMRISVLQGSASGSAVYVETQAPTSNVNGLISLTIGNGVVQSGNFSAINWANGPYFIQTETDPAGGTNYSITGTSQLLSVPYALYAASSGSSLPGPQGPAGTNGTNGTNGLSAYQMAVNNGFVGTETQWLASLHGATGAQGSQGATGAQGPAGTNGTNGTNGLSAYQMAVNNGFVGTETQWLASLHGATGAQGATGIQGTQGPAGTNGANGTNGTNGLSAYQIAVNNGFVGTEAQWLASLQGATGSQGAQGIAGLQGPQGLTGVTGTQGPQGPAGTNGANGTNGTNGLSAYQIAVNNGFVGTETQWLTSLQGATGPQGITGPQGPQGPQGIAGTSPTDIAFKAYKTAQTSQAQSTQIMFDGVQFNDGNAWNSATSSFTAPSAGVYQFMSHLFINSSSSGYFLSILKINGVTFKMHQHQLPGNQTHSDTFLVKLNVGDTVQLFFESPNSPLQIFGHTNTSFSVATFEGFKIN